MSRARARAAMALSKLSGDEVGIVFGQLCNVFEPSIAVAFSSVSHELREPTQALRQQLRAEHEAVVRLCRRMGMRSCKKLREARTIRLLSFSVTELATLCTLGSLLPALEKLELNRCGATGVQRLAAGLGAGALPAVTYLAFWGMHADDAGVSALAAALNRGALPQLETLRLVKTAIGDAELKTLTPALRRLPALEHLDLMYNPLTDEGLAAFVAPPLPAGSPPPGGLARLKQLDLSYTEVTDAGCAILTAALNSGALPAIEIVELFRIPASAVARKAVRVALAKASVRRGRGNPR